MSKTAPLSNSPLKSATLPRTLKVLGKKWKIQLGGDLLEDQMGICDVRTKTIHLSDNPDFDDDIADTALHECAHMLGYYLDLGLTDKQEEHVVRVLITGLCSVFADNPEFLDWFRDSVHL